MPGTRGSQSPLVTFKPVEDEGERAAEKAGVWCWHCRLTHQGASRIDDDLVKVRQQHLDSAAKRIQRGEAAAARPEVREGPQSVLVEEPGANLVPMHAWRGSRLTTWIESDSEV